MAGLALALASFAVTMAMQPGETLWHAIAAPAEDGAWAFTSIDGTDVSQARYSLSIRWGRIEGFFNGCNSCGFSDDKPSGSKERMLTCTMQWCPTTPRDALAQRFMYGNPDMQMEGDRLLVTLPGHHAELIRKPRQ
ncbi:hypothetical protein [Qipengyuania sp.]|uniref:hypothetical protein n=1 Tax=Qipengyuania sp. TaxID=2004515 RepID=UPI0035C8514C